ncbi:MAG: hypothetical protein AAGA95_21645, partial [Pseudomonadota bacterium]
MFMIARLYPSEAKAKAAAKAFVAAGYSADDVVVLPSSAAAAGEDGAGDAGVDMSTAVRAGSMLGAPADFYLSRLTGGKALVVVTPSFMESRRAEQILDAHDPLPDTHEPPAKEYVPWSEQDTPFSNWLGWSTKADSDTPFSNFWGFGFKEEGLSHLSRRWPPLAPDFMFSDKIGMGFTPKKDTFFNASTKSDRLEGRESSFGMG